MKMIRILFLAAAFVSFFSLTALAQQEQQPSRKALEALGQGDLKRALAILDDEVRGGKSLAANFKLRADVRSMTGDFTGAIADLDKLIELKPEDGELYQRRAELRMTTRGDMADVLADLDKAIVYGIRQEKVYRLRGMIRGMRGDLDGALADYQAAIGLDPRYASAYQGMASIYLRKNDSAKAVEVLEGYVAMIESGEKKPQPVAGTVVAHTSVELQPLTDGQTRAGRDSIFVNGSDGMGNGTTPTREEIEKRTRKLEQSKNTSLIYATLAELYNKRGDRQLALETVNNAIALDPTDFVGVTVLGRIKVDVGDYNGAVADLTKAISMRTPDHTVYLDRGIAYLMLGREADAQKDFDKYLELIPQGKPYLDRRVAEARNKLQH